MGAARGPYGATGAARPRPPRAPRRTALLTREQLEARYTVLRELVKFPDAPPRYVAALVACFDEWGWPGEGDDYVWWPDARVAALNNMRYTDGTYARNDASDMVRYWYEKGVLSIAYTHEECTPAEGYAPDPQARDYRHGPADGAYRCHRMVLPVPPWEWEQRPPREPRNRRAPYEKGMQCPVCKSHRLVATDFQCWDCGHRCDRSTLKKRPVPSARARGAAMGIKPLAVPPSPPPAPAAAPQPATSAPRPVRPSCQPEPPTPTPGPPSERPEASPGPPSELPPKPQWPTPAPHALPRPPYKPPNPGAVHPAPAAPVTVEPSDPWQCLCGGREFNLEHGSLYCADCKTLRRVASQPPAPSMPEGP